MRALAAGVVLVLALASGCEREVTPAEPAAGDPRLAADLELVRAARVLFADASLGASVLDGVARIPGSRLRIVSLAPSAAGPLPEATFAQLSFEQEGDPYAKIAAFEAMFAAESQPGPDLALLELSCDDVDANTDTKALFARYREAIERLRRAHPRTAFVHVTAPLAVRDTGATELAKRLTGLSDGSAQANARRDDYNGRLRAAFRGEPIFDVAALESLWPDGRPERFARRGVSHPSLVPAYGGDCRRLAGAGQERAARALIHALADALRERPPR